MATLGEFVIRAIEQRKLDRLLEEAFYAGFYASSPTFNGVQDDAYWNEVSEEPAEQLAFDFITWRETVDA